MSIRENPSSVDSVLLDVEGMKCGACVKSVEQTLESQKNVLNASVNLVERTALIDVKEKAKKIAIVFTRATVIMEPLTGVMIALLIFVTGKLIISGEIDINNFFSFLAAMMLAYQPVRSLATLNVGINQGLSAAKRILPIIDIENKINDNNSRNNFTTPNNLNFTAYVKSEFFDI